MEWEGCQQHFYGAILVNLLIHRRTFVVSVPTV